MGSSLHHLLVTCLWQRLTLARAKWRDVLHGKEAASGDGGIMIPDDTSCLPLELDLGLHEVRKSSMGSPFPVGPTKDLLLWGLWTRDILRGDEATEEPSVTPEESSRLCTDEIAA